MANRLLDLNKYCRGKSNSDNFLQIKNSENVFLNITDKLNGRGFGKKSKKKRPYLKKNLYFVYFLQVFKT